jgi:3-hydroxybutyryl-CoA dehydrogenase
MGLRFPKVGVIGAGVMGRDLAQALAQTGHVAVLVDVTDPILEGARRDIVRGLMQASLFDRAARAADHGAILERVVTTTDYGKLADVDFVVENATEDWATKEAVYRILDRMCPPRCVLAANTSAIAITRIAAVVADPTRVIGMHFMNPVPKKPIVEVIRGRETSEATVGAASELLSEMGKRMILVRDSPGFVTNRVLMLTINEAIAVVHEGVARPAEVDDIFVGCFAHAMGPLATADLIGLDTILRSLQVLRESFGNPKFDPSPLLVEMVESGRLGRKSGVGFFDYHVKGNAVGRS